MRRRLPSSPEWQLRYKQKELGDLFFEILCSQRPLLCQEAGLDDLLRLLLTWLSP